MEGWVLMVCVCVVQVCGVDGGMGQQLSDARNRLVMRVLLLCMVRLLVCTYMYVGDVLVCVCL